MGRKPKGRSGKGSDAKARTRKPESTPSAPTGGPAGPTQHLEITPAVQKAAANAIEAISAIDFDQLGEHGISFVRLVCTTSAAAEALATDLNQKSAGREVEAPLLQYLPLPLTDCIIDAAETARISIPVPASLCGAMEGFIRVFGRSEIVRMAVDAADSSLESDVVAFKDVIGTAHRALLHTVELMLSAVTRDPVHELRIEASGNIMKELRFFVDGQEVDLGARTSRALCVLSLLQKEQPFKVDLFMELYSNNTIDARRDFHTIMRAVRKTLPQLKITAKKGTRSVKGVRIISRVPEKGLRAFLRVFLEERTDSAAEKMAKSQSK